jgi:hypothetical protein
VVWTRTCTLVRRQRCEPDGGGSVRRGPDGTRRYGGNSMDPVAVEVVREAAAWTRRWWRWLGRCWHGHDSVKEGGGKFGILTVFKSKSFG